jgi:hypothetical protein
MIDSKSVGKMRWNVFSVVLCRMCKGMFRILVSSVLFLEM